MSDSVLPSGPIFGPDSVVIRVDGGGADPAVGVHVWPEALNADLAAAGLPTRYYLQPPRVTLATRPGTPDLAFSATVMVQSPVGPHPEYVGGSCTFSCTAALPEGAEARIIEKLADHDYPDPPARIAPLFAHRRGDPDPELRMVPVTAGAVSCVVEQPPTGTGPLFLSVQGGPGGGIDVQARSTFLVSFSPAAAEAVVTGLRDAAAPPFIIRYVLTERFDTGPATLTANVDADLEKLHEVFAAAVPPGEPWPGGAAAGAAYRSAVASGAVRTGLTETGTAPLDPSVLTWLDNTDELRRAVFGMVKDQLFDVAPDVEPHLAGQGGRPAPAWWTKVFGDARVTLKREPVSGGVSLREALTLHGALSVEQTIEGGLAELAAAARRSLNTYLTVVAL